MKFKDMPYKRVALEQAQHLCKTYTERLKNAADAQEAIATVLAFGKENDEIQTMASLAYVRNTIDTNDAYYDQEKNHYDEIGPQIEEAMQSFLVTLLNSPFRCEMEATWGNLIFLRIEMQLKCFSPEIVPQLQEENRLCSEYQKLIASAQIEYDGKTLTLSQLTPYHENPDREVRKGSFLARAAWFSAQADTLDRIFDDLVKVRTQMAQKLGFENYIPMGYYRMSRDCYTMEDVAAFRASVLQHIVPVASRLKKEQAERLELPILKLYDDPCEYKTGNAAPIGTPEEIFAHGKKMYHEMSPETAEFIDVMLENELFDVLSRKGKAAGGYCTGFPMYKVPFIFANFNGTSGDIDVLTHEAGHAFADYRARDIEPAELRNPSLEGCEIHSMSMEFFAWPWMEGFFGDKTAKYYNSHLSGALTFIPYGTIVDYFQHIVYENPELTQAQRNAKWKELEAQFRPWLDLEETPFYEEGRRWQAQTHIYGRPFYYIDYCIAQTVALQFWALAQKDREEAWRRYMQYVGMAGTRSLVDLIKGAGMESPFGEAALKTVADAAIYWLDENRLSDEV